MQCVTCEIVLPRENRTEDGLLHQICEIFTLPVQFRIFCEFHFQENALKLVSNSCPVQVVGSVVLILGLWVVVDKYNFLRVTKLDAIIKVTL